MSADEAVPGGCTMTTVGASCQIHLQLKGLVDVAREVGLAVLHACVKCVCVDVAREVGKVAR